MMPFQSFILQIIFGLIVSVSLGITLGWKLLPATDTVIKRVGWCYVVATVLLMAYALTLMGLSMIVEAFSVLPIWSAKAALFGYLTIAGVTRGLSIQKNGRWV